MVTFNEIFIAFFDFCAFRERTKLVYSMYSRMSGEAVKRNLMKLGVDFFVLEDSWCTRRTRYLRNIYERGRLFVNSPETTC